MASHFRQPQEGPHRAESAHTPAPDDLPPTGAQLVGFIPAAGRGAEAGSRAARHPHGSSRPQRLGTDVRPSGAVAAGRATAGHAAHKRPGHAADDPQPKGGPRRDRARTLSNVLFAIGIALILVAAGIFAYNQWQYHKQDATNEELAGYAQVDAEGSQPPQVDWDALRAVNPEVVAWVQVPGTVVNFPVYQASDNEKYLHTNAHGEYSVGGQVFLDAQNAAPGMVDAQTIIYGHHLRNGAMFKPIFDMRKQAMFDSVPTVWYVTPEHAYELEPLLLYETEDTDTAVRTFDFASADEMRSYLSGLLDRAVTSRPDAADAISRADHVLTLCTCNYSDGDSGRTLLVCVPKDAAQDAPAQQ